MRRFLFRTGFTFIELIIGMTIFTVIVVTVYSVFYMGIKTWRRGQDEDFSQRLRLGFLKVDKELKDTFFFSKIPFKGNSREMVFPLSISDNDLEKLYIVTYRVDGDNEDGLYELVRSQKAFSEYMEIDEERVKRILPLVKDIRFEYAYENGDTVGTFEWQESWNGGEQNKLPSGVRISLVDTTSDERYSKVILFQR